MENLSNFKYLAGIDEVGRGPVAGPVTVALVWVELASLAEIKKLIFPQGIKDSKKLSVKKRELIFTQLSNLQDQGQINFLVAHGSHTQIDDLGISPTIFGLIRSLLKNIYDHKDQTKILLDGSLRAPAMWPHQETIIRGDEKEEVIALASIVAKVTRDRLMTDLHAQYPQYDFPSHKGYGTKAHYEAIEKHGLSEVHRRSFLKRILKSSATEESREVAQ